jgi:hypothetical protein
MDSCRTTRTLRNAPKATGPTFPDAWVPTPLASSLGHSARHEVERPRSPRSARSAEYAPGRSSFPNAPKTSAALAANFRRQGPSGAAARDRSNCLPQRIEHRDSIQGSCGYPDWRSPMRDSERYARNAVCGPRPIVEPNHVQTVGSRSEGLDPDLYVAASCVPACTDMSAGISFRARGSHTYAACPTCVTKKS